MEKNFRALSMTECINGGEKCYDTAVCAFACVLFRVFSVVFFNKVLSRSDGRKGLFQKECQDSLLIPGIVYCR